MEYISDLDPDDGIELATPDPGDFLRGNDTLLKQATELGDRATDIIRERVPNILSIPEDEERDAAILQLFKEYAPRVRYIEKLRQMVHNAVFDHND
jgi:hypothetical protein